MLSGTWNKVRSLFFFAGLLVYTSVVWGEGNQVERKIGELDDMEVPDSNYAGPVFHPSYNFPQAPVESGLREWEGINFKNDPERYMYALLSYILEGQNKERWTVSSNLGRKWYHMPWMGPGGKGREFINGLTSERRSRPFELGPTQPKCRQNWAVGFYNPIGGYALGRIWAPVVAGTSPNPDLKVLPFPVGTVVAKVLYTEATDTEVSLLVGAPTIKARIIKDKSPEDDKCPDETINKDGTEVAAERVEAELRLLQLDVAVRDPAAGDYTGWIFGTFIYDGRIKGEDPWAKLRPVGLMWGNDSDLTDEQAMKGVRPVEGVVLSDFGFNRSFGRGGRMNGPVDNPSSACLSCHMTAQAPSSADMAPPKNVDWPIVSCWFRTLKSNEAFGPSPTNDIKCGAETAGLVALDYSLQLAVGVRNITIRNINTKNLGVSIFGVNLFKKPPINNSAPLVIDSAKSFPISRD
jgi:hypothetical protein